MTHRDDEDRERNARIDLAITEAHRANGERLMRATADALQAYRRARVMAPNNIDLARDDAQCISDYQWHNTPKELRPPSAPTVKLGAGAALWGVQLTVVDRKPGLMVIDGVRYHLTPMSWSHVEPLPRDEFIERTRTLPAALDEGHAAGPRVGDQMPIATEVYQWQLPVYPARGAHQFVVGIGVPPRCDYYGCDKLRSDPIHHGFDNPAYNRPTHGLGKSNVQPDAATWFNVELVHDHCGVDQWPSTPTDDTLSPSDPPTITDQPNTTDLGETHTQATTTSSPAQPQPTWKPKWHRSIANALRRLANTLDPTDHPTTTNVRGKI